MAANGDVFMWLWLPWNPIRHHVVSINWKYKEISLDVSIIKSIGWMVSKVGGKSPIDAPPPAPYALVQLP